MLTHLNPEPAKPDRVVIIGAGGFVGGALEKRLAKEGIDTLGLTRRDVDLLSPDAASMLSQVIRPTDSVVAVSAIAPCKTTQMLADNMTLTVGITTALASVNPAHVINISSDAVYPDEPVPLTEAVPAAPGSLHGAMHLAREIAFEADVKSPLAILRPSLLYGADDPHNGYGPNRFRRLAEKGEAITLFGEGEERRDHVFIEDVAEIIYRVLCHKSTGVLNVATGEVQSFKEIAEQAVAISGNSPTISGSPRSGPMPHNGYRPFAIDACKAAFPDFSYTPLAEGLRRAAGA
ncbi:MAG: NAD-dependent epimerase/dehydratase [Pseudomonadota bacterium]